MNSRENETAVITVYISKGGVGKTTLVGLLGQYLAGRGQRVAIVDLDIQGSQSTLFDLVDETGRGREALHRVLRRELDPLAAMTPVPGYMIPGDGELFVIQGGPQTKEAIEEISHAPVRFGIAQTADIIRGPINTLKGHVDYILIDMGPSDQITALAGLVATDHLIMPTTMDYLSVERIAPVLEEVEVAQQIQPITITGIVPMMTNYYFGGLRKSQTVQAGEQYLTTYDNLLLKDGRGLVDLPYHEDIRKVMWAGVSLFSDDVKGKAKEDVQRVLNAICNATGVC